MWCRETGAVVKYATAWRASQLPAAVVKYANAWRASLLLLPGARCSRWAWSPHGVNFMFCLCPEFEVPLRVGGVIFSLVVGEDVVLALDDVVEVGIPVAAVKGAVARCGEWVWCLSGGIFSFVPEVDIVCRNRSRRMVSRWWLQYHEESWRFF